MQFLENSFGTVTLFFTLMYIPFDDLDTIFSEVARVLKPGGTLLVWDVRVDVPSEAEEKKYFMVPLKVTFPDGSKTETGYGVKIRNQDMDSFVSAAEKHGFELVDHERMDLTFFAKLALRKG